MVQKRAAQGQGPGPTLASIFVYSVQLIKKQVCRDNTQQLRYTSQAGPSREYTDNAHDVHMTRYATGGGDISCIRVKNA